MKKKEISAGGVVFKNCDGNVIEVIIYSRNNATQWCLPKGKIENGETLEQAALREVKEETGLLGKIVCPLGNVFYQYRDKRRNLVLDKTVHFFLMYYAGGEISIDDPGVEEVIWSDLDEAVYKLSFDNEKNILKQAKQIIINQNNL